MVVWCVAGICGMCHVWSVDAVVVYSDVLVVVGGGLASVAVQVEVHVVVVSLAVGVAPR